jgi:HSP20 family protein
MASLIPWGRGRSRGGELMTRRVDPLSRLQDQFDALWDRFLSNWPTPVEEGFGSQRLWDVDMEEGENEVIVRAEVPGFEPSDLDVEVNNDILTIKAEKKQEKEEAGKRHERRYAMYRRSLTLPPGTNPEKAEANYRNGVLELHFGKSPEAVGKRIPIHAEGQPQGQLAQEKSPQQSAAAGSQAEKKTAATKQG